MKKYTYELYDEGKRNDEVYEKLHDIEEKLIKKGSQVIHSWHNETHYVTPRGYTWIFTYGDNILTSIPSVSIRICKGKSNIAYFNQVY